MQLFQLPLCPSKPGTLSSEEIQSPYSLCWTNHPGWKHFSLVQTQAVLLCSASACGSYGAWPTSLLYCPLWRGGGILLVQIERGACETVARQLPWIGSQEAPGGQYPLLKPPLLCLHVSKVLFHPVLWLHFVFFGNSHSMTQWAEVFRLLLLEISHPCHLLNKNWKQTTRQIYKLEKNLKLWIVISRLLD